MLMIPGGSRLSGSFVEYPEPLPEAPMLLPIDVGAMLPFASPNPKPCPGGSRQLAPAVRGV